MISQMQIALLLREASRVNTYQRRLQIFEELTSSIPKTYDPQAARPILHNAYFSMSEFCLGRMLELYPLFVSLTQEQRINLNAGAEIDPEYIHTLSKIDWQYVDQTGCLAWRSFSLSYKCAGGFIMGNVNTFFHWYDTVTEEKKKFNREFISSLRATEHVSPHSIKGPMFQSSHENKKAKGMSLVDWAGFQNIHLYIPPQ